jgi:TatD DNase family protein
LGTPFTYFDAHTHKKYVEDDVLFIRNAFHHLNFNQLNKINYNFSVGIHPWDVQRNFEISLAQIHATALHKNCLAIGECGLDYFIKTDKELQSKVFIQHLELAESLRKPLIIHCVRAYHDLIPLIKKCTIPIILHQYVGSAEISKSLLLDSVYFSFGKQFFRENFNTDIFEIIPFEKILFETDTMPIHIEDVYLKAATVLDIEFEVLKDQINNNAQTILQN